MSRRPRQPRRYRFKRWQGCPLGPHGRGAPPTSALRSGEQVSCIFVNVAVRERDATFGNPPGRGSHRRFIGLSAHDKIAHAEESCRAHDRANVMRIQNVMQTERAVRQLEPLEGQRLGCVYHRSDTLVVRGIGDFFEFSWRYQPIDLAFLRKIAAGFCKQRCGRFVKKQPLDALRCVSREGTHCRKPADSEQVVLHPGMFIFGRCVGVYFCTCRPVSERTFAPCLPPPVPQSQF